MRPMMPILLSVCLCAGLATQPVAEAGSPVRPAKRSTTAKKKSQTTKRKAPVRPKRTRTSAVRKRSGKNLRRGPQKAQRRSDSASRQIKNFGKTSRLVKQLLKNIRRPGVDASDPANGWYVPALTKSGKPEKVGGQEQYVGFVQESEAKFQVDGKAVKRIESAMTGSDFGYLFGADLGGSLSGSGFSIEKQSQADGSVAYSDVYFDTPTGKPIATLRGVSARHRQIGDQIGTEDGMFEVKLYTDEGSKSAVQDRLEIRKRTNNRYRRSDLLARKRRVRMQNPLHYLKKAARAKGDKELEKLADSELSPFISIKQDRVEYNIKGANGDSLYLITLDRVTGSYAGDTPRKNLDGKTVRKGDSAQHVELEVEQMFNAADPKNFDALAKLSGQKVDAQNADKVAKAMRDKLALAMEASVQGLSRSARNKPGIVAQNLRLVD